MLAFAGTSLFAADPGLVIISDLNQKLLAKQKSSVGREQAKPASAAPTPTPVERESFSSRVSFLTDGNLSVMIPKGALIHAPANHRISVGDKIQGKLVEWDDFLLANRSAIRLEPVDLDHLQGNATLNPKTMESVLKANLPTLTVYQNRVVLLPKSIHPLTAASKP
ncbi:MAG: hypothetical protein ACRCXD_12265 [Luteolibacter sp.]